MKEKVIALLEDIIPGFDADDEKLYDGGTLTSLNVLQLIASIDDELDLQVPPAKIRPEYFNSVAGIVRLVEELEDEQ